MIGRPIGTGEGSAGPHDVRAEINVTSLVDVAFTLLIIFMITAPILQGGVEVTVPKAPASPLESEDGLVITVDGAGRIFIDETEVSLEQFRAAIRPVLRRRGYPTVYIKGDTNVPYGVVLKVIGRLKETDVEAVSLVAEPENLEP
ncbi:MAG: ExbD/TolR family protein [Gemmatimonadota bacterium]